MQVKIKVIFALACAVTFPVFGESATIVSANAAVEKSAMIEQEIERLIVPAVKALEQALAREAELKEFPAWEHVKTLDDWLRSIRDLRVAGDLAGAYNRAMSEYTRWYASRATHVVHAMPFMVLGPIRPDRFTDREWVTPRPRPGSLVEPYLGEFEIAPNSATYALPGGSRTYYKLARALDPWQARDELAVAGMEVSLRQAWLIGDQLDFAENVDAPADAWGVYYIWGEVYAPTRRRMNLDLLTEAPCMYLWRSGSLYVVRRCPEPASPECGITMRGGGFTLLEGWNRIFIKILMRPGDAFSMRFMHHPHSDGYMDDLQYRLPEQNQ